MVGSQCIKILLITNLKKKTISSLKSSVHDEPVWFILDNLACSPVKRPLVQRGTREREKRKGLFHPPPPRHPPFPSLSSLFFSQAIDNLALCAALTAAQWYCTRLKKISDAWKHFSYERDDLFLLFSSNIETSCQQDKKVQIK